MNYALTCDFFQFVHQSGKSLPVGFIKDFHGEGTMQAVFQVIPAGG